MTSPTQPMTSPSPPRVRRRLLRPILGALGAGALVVALAGPATAATRTSSASSRGTARSLGAGRSRPATAETCPKAPPEPHASSAYARDGETWNPADPIDWTLDTTSLGKSTISDRVTDIKRALADATRETGFTFVYKGEVTTKSDDPRPLLIQFLYVPAFNGPYHGSLGKQTNSYLQSGSKKQTVDGDITLLSTLADHYGYYDAHDPTASPEGDVLMHELAAVLGLDNVPNSPAEVMSATATPATYFLQYQAGDNYGLWKVGASLGCSGYAI